MSGKIVKPDMRGIDRNRKGANHASSRQYPVDHSWRVGHRNRMGIGGTDSMHLHHRHPARPPVVQDGQARALAVRRTDLQSVTIVSAVSPVQRIIIVRCTGLFYIQRAFHTPRDLTDLDVMPYSARTMIQHIALSSNGVNEHAI